MAWTPGDAACTSGLSKRLRDSMLAEGIAPDVPQLKTFCYAEAVAIAAEGNAAGGGGGGSVNSVTVNAPLSDAGTATDPNISIGAASAAVRGTLSAAGYTKLNDLPDAATLTSELAAKVDATRTLTAGAGLTGGGSLTGDRSFDVVANADGSIVVNANDVQVGVLATDAQHGARGGGTQHANVVAAGAAGFMTGADKTKLDGLALRVYMVPGISGIQTTTQSSNDERGAFCFDPSTFSASDAAVTRTIKLVAILECSTSGLTCTLELYNITDGATVVSLTSTSTTPEVQTSAALTVPTNLPNSLKVYGLRLKRTSGSGTDSVSCKMCRLEVQYS